MGNSIRKTITKLKIMGKSLSPSLRILSKGSQQLSERLLTQVSIKEGFPSLLTSPLSFEQIVDRMKYKNELLANDFLGALVEMGTLKKNGNTYSWNGRKVEISKPERKLQEIGLAFAKLTEIYSTYLPYALRGHMRTREFTRELILAIWDSLYSSHLYKTAREISLKWGRIPKNCVLLDLGCGTGWSTIDLIRIANPKKVIAVDRSKKAVDIARENIKTANLSDRVEFIACDILKGLPIDEKVEGIFSSLFFHWLTQDQILVALKNIRSSIEPGASFCGMQPLKKDIDGKAYLDVLFRASFDFKGYPQKDFFEDVFVKADFKKPDILGNALFACRSI